jgi:hypothetical protein
MTSFFDLSLYSEISILILWIIVNTIAPNGITIQSYFLWGFKARDRVAAQELNTTHLHFEIIAFVNFVAAFYYITVHVFFSSNLVNKTLKSFFIGFANSFSDCKPFLFKHP